MKSVNVTFEEYIRACVPSTPAYILQDLANSPVARIRARVAENISTPESVLVGLVNDGSAEVRQSLALNARVPEAVLWELAADTDPDVRYAIAENPHIAMEILIFLSADENPYVALRAEETIEAVTNESSHRKGGTKMSATSIERKLRRMLNAKERLTRSDALRLKEAILADDYLSRSERKIIVHAMENDLLDDGACEVFIELLLQRFGASAHDNRAIA
jgi:hypothetical protein